MISNNPHSTSGSRVSYFVEDNGSRDYPPGTPSIPLFLGIRDDEKVSKLDFLKVITKPLTKTVIAIEKSTIKDIAKVRTSCIVSRYFCPMIFRCINVKRLKFLCKGAMTKSVYGLG